MAYKPVKINEYERLKSAQAAGGSVDGVRRKFGRSWDTINRVFKSTSWEDFKDGNVAVTSPPVPRNYDAEESDALKLVRKHRSDMIAHFDAVIEVMKKEM